MTAKSPGLPPRKNSAPFGAPTPRPKGPLVFWGILYLCWFLLLLWMAASQTGD